MTETPPTAPADDSRAHNKNLIFAALAEAGIHSVTVEFDGCGDSGQIEGIAALDAGRNDIPLPSNRKVHLVAATPSTPAVETTLQEAVETLAYDYLDETHMGWANNDGAFGTFVFSVPDRTITLEHNERYTEVDTTTHEF